MRLDISRMSRILPILSILILGGFQTTSAIEYLITDTLGGTSQISDQVFDPNTGLQTVNVWVYLTYSTEETAGRGTGFITGSLALASSNDAGTVAYLAGTSGPAISQPGVYTVENSLAGTTGTGWNAQPDPIFGELSSDLSTLSAAYNAEIRGNRYGTTPGTTYYIYLASATFTVDTSVQSQTTIGASVGIQDWTGTTGSNFPTPTSDSFFITVNAVPEPTTYALAALSCVALGVVGRRKTLKAKKQETASA